MSFSQDIKSEILNNISYQKKNVNLLNAERFGEYLTQIENKDELQKLENDYDIYTDISKLSETEIKYILKGIYLSSGCIVNPNIDYNFEIILKNKTCNNYIIKLLEVLDFSPRYIKRKNNYVIYIKDSEQISTFLSLIGASNALLKFEQIRVEKNVKNNVNRNVNCETANLVKTVSTAVAQIDAINKLKKMHKFSSLDEKLKYVAILRIKYPEASYDKLSKYSTDKISKSGIKHRLDKIIDILKRLENNE